MATARWRPAGWRPSLTARGQRRFGLKWRTAPTLPPSGSRSAWQVLGQTTPANPSRRGSRDSGQNANMVLLVVQIETRPPEQRIGGSVDRRSLGTTLAARAGDRSHRRLPGSHVAPALRRIPSRSDGQRIATRAPSSTSWHGPIWCGRSTINKPDGFRRGSRSAPGKPNAGQPPGLTPRDGQGPHPTPRLPGRSTASRSSPPRIDIAGVLPKLSLHML
jgi:hypothetical protein